MWRYPAIFALLMVAFALVAPPYASVQNTNQDQSRAPYIWEAGNPVLLVHNSVEPSLYKRPCENTANVRQSDLCAQWTSADWTRIGAIVAGVGIGFLLLQIFLTIQALEHTSKATRAMRKANKIAKDTARRTLRAYVSVDLKEIIRLPNNKLQARIKIRNDGATPAHKLYAAGDIIAVTEKEAEEAFSGIEELPESAEPKPYSLPHGRKINSDVVPFDFREFDEATLRKVSLGELHLYIYGKVVYYDVFGKRHVTQYAFDQELIYETPDNYAEPMRFSGGKPRLAPFHNRST